MTYRVISRASRLALVQVDEALKLLDEMFPPDVTPPRFVTRPLTSWGDRNKSVSLLDGQAPADLFTRDLDDELRAGTADFAVHSAKDLPLPLPADLDIVALLPPADQTDALACRPGVGPTLRSLAPGSKVGTSSPLRQKELQALRPDLQIASIRGTIEERLGQLDRGQYDAVIVATCALKRLGLNHRIGEILPFDTHPLQGHLAVTALRSRLDVKALWAPLDLRRRWGRVSLVGAGPGDPELLTLKAARLLREADLVLNDSLANPRILEGLRAEIRFVGKRGDAGGALQDRINRQLYEAAVEGKTVVRLKGGDPMLFGRATEEIDYLEQRLVEVEIVPGVSSALAASAYTQIPLTEREVSSGVAFCLGHPPERIPVPDSDTLVYFMASQTLSTIVDRVLESGRRPETPVALVQNASLPNQRVWTKTLGGLRDELIVAPQHPYASPLLVIVGRVVRFSRLANWFERLPRVWYTGLRADRYARPCRLIHAPLIAVHPVESEELESVLRGVEFDWVVVTSRTTVQRLAEVLQRQGGDARRFGRSRLAAVGRSTAADLERLGLRADIVAHPESETAAGLLAALTRGSSGVRPGQSVWIPGGSLAGRTLASGLSAHGALVTSTVVYETTPVEALPEGFDWETIDEVVVASPSAARALSALAGTPPDRVILCPMGAPTRAALNELFPGRLLGPDVLS